MLLVGDLVLALQLLERLRVGRPPFAGGVQDQALQVASGVFVLPLRVCSTIDVPAGRLACQRIVPHVATVVVSRTSET